MVGIVALWLTSRSETRVAINPEAELADIVTLTERGRLEEAYERALAVRSSAPASPAAANAVSYVLTYAGYVDEAARAIDDLIAASPDYMKQNAWWAPTALLYQRRFERFLQTVAGADTPSARLYRAIADVERGQRASAVQHLAGIESSGSVFNRLAAALRAALSSRQGEVTTMMSSIADQRRTEGDSDGEVTFKQAQILSLAGDAASALAMLDEAVTQGFVCVACFESSSILEPVRARDEYGRVQKRARARHQAFGRRFGLKPDN